MSRGYHVIGHQSTVHRYFCIELLACGKVVSLSRIY